MLVKDCLTKLDEWMVLDRTLEVRVTPPLVTMSRHDVLCSHKLMLRVTQQTQT